MHMLFYTALGLPKLVNHRLFQTSIKNLYLPHRIEQRFLELGLQLLDHPYNS